MEKRKINIEIDFNGDLEQNLKYLIPIIKRQIREGHLYQDGYTIKPYKKSYGWNWKLDPDLNDLSRITKVKKES